MLSNQSPEYFERPQYCNRVSHIEVVQQIVLVNQIAEADEASLRPRLMDQEHGSKIAHSLHVADIRPEVVERSQDVFQRFAEAMDLFEELVQMWECSWNILQDQRRLLEGRECLAGARLIR